MLTKTEYDTISQCLESLGLHVFKPIDPPDFHDFVQYESSDNPYRIYEINRSEKGYGVNTLFGWEVYPTIEKVISVLQQDWNKDNWVYGVDENGEYIDLKEGFESGGDN